MESTERRERGEKFFREVMVMDAPPAVDPFSANGVLDSVFAELWSRPVLSRKERRWITLACVGASATPIPIESHIRAALESGDISLEEMQEFVLHFAFYHGWPRASAMQTTLSGVLAKLEAEKAKG